MSETFRLIGVAIIFIASMWIGAWCIGNGFYNGYSIARLQDDLRLIDKIEEKNKINQPTR